VSFITLGVVSNVWADLLRASSLEEQVHLAVEAGYGYVELRQRALGSCEERVAGDERPWPLVVRLAGLRRSFPALGFNLAVEAPFLTGPVAAEEPYFQRCAQAAAAIGGPHPVLRLVDVSPAPAHLERQETIEELGQGVAELACDLCRQGVRLALENSRQPLMSLIRVIRRASLSLPEEVPIPQLCWDPHNQISQNFLAEDPVETARTLRTDELFEFHFKQGRNGQLQPDVAEGALNWRTILAVLHERGYQGPALFEIPPGPDIWERLERSTAYVRDIIEQIA
jgi:sugar phosphate isomerase/epimerase